MTPWLTIRHEEGSVPPAFVLQRADAKALERVTIASPYEYPVEGKPKSNLMTELRWYLEKFLNYPFHPDTLQAERVLEALKGWGTQAFQALFDRRLAGDWLTNADLVQVSSDDAGVLSWPWEALFDPLSRNYIAHERRVERRLNDLPDLPELKALPKDRINILLVVCRPYERDVKYRSIARPLVELVQSQGLPAHVEVLRPPTFDQLRAHLQQRPGYYHALHFDGHGTYRAAGVGWDGKHQFKGRQGALIFEDEDGEEDPRTASDLSTLLKDHAVPTVVLNACQAGMIDGDAEDAFASVATALLLSGMRSVVAMAYTLYVSGAQVFLPAFYRRLFESASVAEAVRAGRQQMFSDPERVCARGRFKLHDWVLPVLYQQEPLSFEFAKEAKLETRESRLPEEVRGHRDPYGFVGRDSAILAMERAVRRKTPAILVQGLGGVGKTTLARGFLKWMDETGGLDGAMWFDFRAIRSGEFVIHQIGEAFYGESFRLAPVAQKMELVRDALGKTRLFIVWDNFESTAANLRSEDFSLLGQFLDAIHGGRGKVIITSRAQEEWLGVRRFKLDLGGLDGEERWEYCEAILKELGLKVKRDDPELSKLMALLSGHPLAMRVVLPKVESMGAAKVAEALQRNIAELEIAESAEQRQLFGTLRFVEEGLDPELRPLLQLVGLHEGYVHAEMLADMAAQVDASWTRPRVDRLMMALGAAGLIRNVGVDLFESHPLLTSYLRSLGEAAEAAQRAFVEVMGRFANDLTSRPDHEQRVPHTLFSAAFRSAAELAERLSMDLYYAALTQSLAVHAQDCRAFEESARLSARLAEHWSARGIAAGQASAWHRLGMIAEEQRDFVAAREWFLKSLGICEQQGNSHDAAACYHQLGRIAEEQRDFGTASAWYLKSLVIKEQQGDLDGMAVTYHQLGTIAQKNRELDEAREWYLKSVDARARQGAPDDAAITYHQLGMVAQEQANFAVAQEWYAKSLIIAEKQGNLDAAANTYHQLGMIAQERNDFAEARRWYLKALNIDENRGNLHSAAGTYHQLGIVAHLQHESATAREWYLKSLAISENQGNLHGAAITYGQLGLLSRLEGKVGEAGMWLTRCFRAFLETNDRHSADQTVRPLRTLHVKASAEEKAKLEAMWREAGLGEFPQD